MPEEKKDTNPKNPAAVELGRKGGKAGAKNMTAEQRREAPRKAIDARWAKTQELVDEITERSKALEVRAASRAARFFEEAIERIGDELEKVREQERQLTLRKAQLTQSFNALAPLAFPDEKVFDINSLTLADAIRLVIRSTSVPMKARQVQSRLYELGFELVKFNNPNASVHTALNRMMDSGELTLITDPTDDTKYFECGPSLKQTPEPIMTVDKVRALLKVRKDGKMRKGAASQKGQVKTDDAASTKSN
jgi:hypothetical protein